MNEPNLKNLKYHKVIGFRLLDLVSLSDFVVELDRAKKAIKNNNILKSHIGRYYEKDMYIVLKENKIVYLGKGNTETKVVDLGNTPILNSFGFNSNTKTQSKIKIKLGDLTEHRSLYCVYDFNLRKGEFAISESKSGLFSLINMQKLSVAYESNINKEMSIDELNKNFALNIRTKGWYCKVGDLVICDIDSPLGSFKVDKIFNKFMCKSDKKAFDLIIFPPNIKYIAFSNKRAISKSELKFSPSTSVSTVVKIGKDTMSLSEFISRAYEFKCDINFY